MSTPVDRREGAGEPRGGMRSSAPTPGVHGPPEALRPAPVGGQAAVSAGHPLVVRAMERILDAGGNAVDAGVAGCLCACVVQVDMCNLGGIAPTVVRPAGTGEVWALDGVGAWSATVTLDAHLARHGGQLPLGGGSAVVPGAVGALLGALERFGTMSFGDVTESAIGHAREGVVLDTRTARSLALLGRVYSRWTSSTDILWPEGRPPRLGDRLRQPALASLLEAMGAAERQDGGSRAEGVAAARAAFYTGEPARLMAEQVTAGGGWMTPDDLAGHRCEIVPATRHECFGWSVCVPGPHSQAPALLQALAVLERVGPGRGAGTADQLHRQAEAFKLVFADREAFFGDAGAPGAIEELLGESHLDALAARLDPERSVPFTATPGGAGRTVRHDTTYIACVDADGTAFSASPSDTIDGAPLHPELGIMVSPRGVQSRVDRGHPAVLGPGRRPRITPAPALALQGDGDRARAMAFGCPGGDVILQAMAQVFLAVAHFGLEPQPAVELPRAACFDFPASFFPFPHAPRRLAVEAHLPDHEREELQMRGHEVANWPAWDFDAGGVALAMDLLPPTADGGRVLGAAADPRRSGEARAW